ncbi:aldo/keto reductase [Uniformispora flossi]|uniref:aldo/keto reductase n=1 Tax=Uniformispora flossi TaxID=3390723 RepID=UPI003C2B6ED4
MRTTTLGTDGPLTSVQGLGCMGMSDFYAAAAPERDRSLATLARAHDLGVVHFDTSDMYGSGANEELLGAFFAGSSGRREKTLLATKFGVDRDAAEGERGVRGDAAYVRAACDASLKRLGTDVIDLYYMHRRDTTVPIEETVWAMAELVKAGKVRYLGLSEVTAGEIRAAAAVHPIHAVQAEWSVFARDIEASVLPAVREVGAALVAYSPLGRGFLSGKFAGFDDLPDGDFRRNQPRFVGENGRANAELLAPLRNIAAAHGATPAQVALAWVHSRTKADHLPVVPIPGTTNPDRLAENAAAADLALTADEIAALEPIAGRVAGDRYAEMTLTHNDRA